jgi:hypothetical protein
MLVLRRLRALIAITAISFCGLFAAPAHAHALLLEPILLCGFSGTITFDPGVTLVAGPQAIGGELRLGNKSTLGIDCSSLSLPIVAGETVGTEIDGDGVIGCLPGVQLSGGASGTITVRWYDGNGDSLGTSIAEWTAAVQGLVPVVTIEVVGGTYAPLIGTDVVVTSVVPTSINGSCVFDPIVSIGFTATSVFLPLPV